MIRTIPIQTINEQQLHLTELRAMLQRWNNETCNFVITPRARDAFTLYLQGGATYTIINPDTNTEETLCVSKGDLVYLPKNSRYSVTFHPDKNGPAQDYLLNFSLYDENFCEVTFANKVKRVFRNAPSSLIDDFASMRSVFKDSVLNTNQLQALAFQILSQIGSLANARSMKKQGYGLLIPGISYMESHLSEEFSIEDLAKKCNVSETYFRRQFKAYTGKTPLQYKNDFRIQKAMVLLTSKELNLQEISDLLGFCDCAYFCNIFKKATGFTPSDYVKSETIP